MKFQEIFEGHLVVTDKNWVCDVTNKKGNEKQVPLALYIEIINMDDATGEREFKDYPFVVSMSIVAAKPHKSFNDSDKPSNLSLIYDTVSYMGGVPVDHVLLDTDKLNSNVTGELKAKDAKLITNKQDYGTLAAQQGKGAEITYPQFKTYNSAETWAKTLIENYADMHMTLIGFILDRPINMIGDTGWDIIQKQVNGLKK